MKYRSESLQCDYSGIGRRVPLLTRIAVVVAVGCFAIAMANAQTLTVLYSFTSISDGFYPSAGVIRDSKGTLYGTTWQGGTSNLGTVFKLSPSGAKTILHNFAGGSDGAVPTWGLLRDAQGNLYGTTDAGGGSPNCTGTASGCGTVYKLNAAGMETVIQTFSGRNGTGPVGLVRDSAGNFYGGTQGGGANRAGCIYKLSPTGTETMLYSFTGGQVGGTDGASAFGALVRDSQGNLYGTTVAGGPGNFGTVFKVDSTGKERVLYTFTGGNDGNVPYGGLIRDAAGNLYGITTYGGAYKAGTVFKVDKSGNETVLHSFGATTSDGTFPWSWLIEDSSGNFYGTTSSGGNGSGTVFKLDSKGTETVLYSFTGADGQYPVGGLVRDLSGNLYGTTQQGGAFGWGTVFKLAPK